MSSEARTMTFSEVPKGRLIIWLVVAGEMVIFGGGIVAYLLYRLNHLAVYDALASLTNTWLGALNTVVLLTSSFFIVKAHDYAAKKELKKMRNAMFVTIALGGVFLVVKTVEWVPKIKAGLGLNDGSVFWGGASTAPGHTFWLSYFFLTGMHGAHVILGMITIFIVWLSVRKGENLHRVEMAGIYWHFVDLVWIFLFPLFYLSR